MDVPTWVEIVNRLAPPGIAAISAFYVFLQYKRAQRWKATDLAAAVLEKLDTDQALALACQALDWGVGPLIIPDRYRPLFLSDLAGKAPSVMEHDPAVLSIAVETRLNAATLGDPRGLVYRYSFIALFNHLDNMFKLLATKQLREEDIDGVGYWLEMLRYYQYAPAKMDRTLVFQPALREWGYSNVILLGQRLKVDPWLPPDVAKSNRGHSSTGKQSAGGPDPAILSKPQ